MLKKPIMSTNINIKSLHNLVDFFEDPKNMKIPIGKYLLKFWHLLYLCTANSENTFLDSFDLYWPLCTMYSNFRIAPPNLELTVDLARTLDLSEATWDESHHPLVICLSEWVPRFKSAGLSELRGQGGTLKSLISMEFSLFFMKKNPNYLPY